MSAPKDKKKTRKNSETFFTSVLKASLNKQVLPNVLHLFKHGVICKRFLMTFNELLVYILLILMPYLQ